jgi:type I restriction enzyme S subunit
MDKTYRYLKFVNFKELSVWDVKYYLQQTQIFNKKYKTALFKDFIIVFQSTKEKINDDKIYKIIGVRTYGFGAYINREVYGKELIMRTYQYCPINHLIWCKVDTKNGAFGIVNEQTEGCYASSNMSLAKIDLTKINVQYLQMLFRLPRFNKFMDSFAKGSTNRKYLSFEQLLNEISIPLPTLAEQTAIVAAYQAAQAEADRLQNEATQLERDIESYLNEILGIEIKKTAVKKGLQFVRFKDIREWGIDKILNVEKKTTNFSLAKFGKNKDLFLAIFRGKSPKYANTGVVILNQKCNRWNEILLEHAKIVSKDWLNTIDKKFFTQERDILINSTGEGTLGRSSVVSSKFEGFLYDSHILLLRVNEQLVNSDYLVTVFNSKFIQKQIDDIKSAQSTKQTELGIDNLLKLQIPLPPLSMQLEIVAKVSLMREAIKENRAAAAAHRARAILAFESDIFDND